MSKINKIRLSGTDYDIQDVSATSVVEVTQQQYDDLPASAKTDNILYIITDAQAGDLTNYYTKTETDNAITAATSTKQDQLVSGTNIKTINNESLLGSGNIDIQGGSTYTAGRGISIANNAISVSLPISAGTGTNSIAEGDNTKASGIFGSHAEGYASQAIGWGAHSEGNRTVAYGNYSHAEGNNTIANGNFSHSEGASTIANNNSEHASGQYNNSVSASTTFGDSGNTLFSVGNGTANNARHNAFEIRQNGDIYLSSGGTDIKLQDHLGGGGGGGTVESAITSGSTNAVESKAIWSATTFNKDVLLTFNGRYSTNYPNGCTKLNVEVAGSNNSSSISFYSSDELSSIGSINIINTGSISVINSFNGASYEISGTTVIITYPTVTSVTRIDVYGGDYVYKAVVEGAWVNENTYMSVEVDGKIKALDDKKLDATAYTPVVVDSQLNAASTNPVQNQALYSELRFDNGESETTLTFENGQSTNYPNGCTKLNVEVGSNNYSFITFYSDNQNLGNISIANFGSIEVTNNFNGASYEISGTTVIITYPTVTSVTRIDVSSNGNNVYKAVVSSVTPLKDQVTANTTALGGKQDTLVSGTNIKTINNQSLLGSGNIDIQGGGGGSSYTAGDGIDITNNVISVSGVVMSSAITTSITSSSTDAQVPSAKAVYDAIGDIETLLSQI